MKKDLGTVIKTFKGRNYLFEFTSHLFALYFTEFQYTPKID